MDDGYATGLGVCRDRRKQPLFFKAAVEFMEGDVVVITYHDSELNPGRHATTGPLGNLVDDHDVVHVVVVVAVGGVHAFFCVIDIL
jgi:hypothetical protein